MSSQTIGFDRALSELSAANNFLDSYSYIEISRIEKPYDAEIEYLESTGTQYIDTGLTANSSLGFNIRASISQEWGHAIGASSGAAAAAGGMYLMLFRQDGKAKVQRGSLPSVIGPVTSEIDVRTYFIDTVTNQCGVDSTVETRDTGSFDNGKTFLLFGHNTPQSGRILCSSKIWYAKLFVDGTLIRDYIPVRIGTVGCLYDKVSGKIFKNAGSGNFICGQDTKVYAKQSFKTPLSALNTTMIETYSLYRNLNDIFNSSNYISCAYFGHDTYFKKNPYVHRENNKDYGHLTNGQQLITRETFRTYMNDVGICIPVMDPNSTYHYYDADTEDWKVSKDKFPIVMSYQNDSIWTIKSNLKFEYAGDNLFITPEVISPKNIMLDVCGNIMLDKEYEPGWYDQQNFMVGITIDGKVITTEYLKNILKIDDYVIGQFHMHCPIHDNTPFRVFTTAQCQFFVDAEEDDFPRKLYSGINSVNLSYYD